MATLIQKWFGEDDRAAWIIFVGVFLALSGAIGVILGSLTGHIDYGGTAELIGGGLVALGVDRWARHKEKISRQETTIPATDPIAGEQSV